MYCPDKGDIVWLDFSPQKGHEQAGKRPAICISSKAYNEKTNLALFCPITSTIKGYPFEVVLPIDFSIQGVILSDQIRSLDWQQRNSSYIGTISEDLFQIVLAKITALFT
jgi:mRNA interferase MazF